DMFGQAIAEFEFTLVRANAPLDQFARGHKNALSRDQKRGALLFFGKARCVECHAVSGTANEMFSDFKQHVIVVPHIAPLIRDVAFYGPGQDEELCSEPSSLNLQDPYRSRTSTLRHVVLQLAFFHNRSFTPLEDAVRHHLNVFSPARNYDAVRAGVTP